MNCKHLDFVFTTNGCYSWKIINMKNIINEIKESVEVKSKILEDKILLNKVMQACDIVYKAYENGNKTLFAGNGGSAVDSNI